MNTSIVDTSTGITKLVGALEGLCTRPPSLYIDLEGVNLCRHGTVSIMQLYILPTQTTYLIDVYTLGDKAFSTFSSAASRTLKETLESESVPKVFFDVRNDSDALHGNFRIRLAGIQDL